MQPQQPQQPASPQGGMNFDQNPFEEMVKEKMAGGGMHKMPDGQMMQNSQMQGAGQNMMPEALQPGKTGDGVKFLMSAIQGLHGYLGYSTDPQEVSMLRNLINIVTQLMTRDQEKATQAMEQGQPAQTGQPAPQNSGAPTV